MGKWRAFARKKRVLFLKGVAGMATIFERTAGSPVFVLPGKGPSREIIFDALRVYDQCIGVYFGLSWRQGMTIQKERLRVYVESVEVIERERGGGGYATKLVIDGWEEDNCGVRIHYDLVARSGAVTLFPKWEQKSFSLTNGLSREKRISIIETPSASTFCDTLRMGYDNINMRVRSMDDHIGLLKVVGACRMESSPSCKDFIFWGGMLHVKDTRKFVMHLNLHCRAGVFWYI